MDLLEPLCGAYLNQLNESAVKQLICLLLVLLIQGGYQILHPFGKHLTFLPGFKAITVFKPDSSTTSVR